MKYIILIIITLLFTSCDNFTVGEGVHNYGISKQRLDGHSYILYRSKRGCSILHDLDCGLCTNRSFDASR
jgi:hypothetical protein